MQYFKATCRLVLLDSDSRLIHIYQPISISTIIHFASSPSHSTYLSSNNLQTPRTAHSIIQFSGYCSTLNDTCLRTARSRYSRTYTHPLIPLFLLYNSLQTIYTNMSELQHSLLYM